MIIFKTIFQHTPQHVFFYSFYISKSHQNLYRADFPVSNEPWIISLRPLVTKEKYVKGWKP